MFHRVAELCHNGAKKFPCESLSDLEKTWKIALFELPVCLMMVPLPGCSTSAASSGSSSQTGMDSENNRLRNQLNTLQTEIRNLKHQRTSHDSTKGTGKGKSGGKLRRKGGGGSGSKELHGKKLKTDNG